MQRLPADTHCFGLSGQGAIVAAESTPGELPVRPPTRRTGELSQESNRPKFVLLSWRRESQYHAAFSFFIYHSSTFMVTWFDNCYMSAVSKIPEKSRYHFHPLNWDA